MLHPHRPAATDHILRPQTVCAPALPLISSRWTPEQVLRRDTETGTFEHINPRDFSNDALYLQQSLLYREPARPRRVSWFGLLLPLVVLAGVVFWHRVTP